MYDKEKLLQELKSYIERYDYIPYSNELKQIPELASKNTYVRNFGGYNNALVKIGVKPKKNKRLPVLHKICNSCNSSYETKDHSSKYCCRDCFYSSQSTKEKNLCKNCKSNHSRYSDFCSNLCRLEETMKSKTLGECSSYEQQNKYRAIRGYAHSYFKALGKPTSCKVCGYNLHVELCHIKPVSQFVESDTVWDCNKPENIVFLCRNCHWEFDNGILDMV